jgi:hypothetical protein
MPLISFTITLGVHPWGNTVCIQHSRWQALHSRVCALVLCSITSVNVQAAWSCAPPSTCQGWGWQGSAPESARVYKQETLAKLVNRHDHGNPNKQRITGQVMKDGPNTVLAPWPKLR